MNFADEFLPTQSEYRKLLAFNDQVMAEHAVYDMVVGVSRIEHPSTKFKVEYPPDWPAERMASNPISMRLLQMLLRMSGAKRVLEIGTFVGISAMYFAEAVGRDGNVITVEKGEYFATLARRNVAANQFDNIIVLQGDAVTELETGTAALPGYYDFAFIDGDKERYPEIFALVVPMVRPGGLIVVDDVLFHGDVLNQHPTTPKGEGCKRMLAVARDLGWPKLLLPLANGMLILVKP